MLQKQFRLTWVIQRIIGFLGGVAPMHVLGENGEAAQNVRRLHAARIRVDDVIEGVAFGLDTLHELGEVGLGLCEPFAKTNSIN